MADWLIAAGGDGTNAIRGAGSAVTAFASVQLAFADVGVAAGDRFYLLAGGQTDYLAGNLTIVSPGSSANPCFLYVVGDFVAFEFLANDIVFHIETTLDVRLEGSLVAYGLRVNHTDDLFASDWTLYGGAIYNAGGSGRVLSLGNSGSDEGQRLTKFFGTTITTGSLDLVYVPAFGHALLDGVIIAGDATSLCSMQSSARGATLTVKNTPLTQFTTLLRVAVPDAHINISGCSINAAYSWPVINHRLLEIDIENSAPSGNFSYFHNIRFEGESLFDTSLVRSAEYNLAGEKFSVLLSTTASACAGHGVGKHIATLHDVDLTLSKTFTVHLAQLGASSAPAALNDLDFNLKIEVLDVANQSLIVGYESNGAVLPTDSPTPLPVSSVDWFDASDSLVAVNITKQLASVTLVPAPGLSAAKVKVSVELFAPSLADGVNVCPDVAVS